MAFSIRSYTPHASSDAKRIYSSDETDGTNDYLRALLDPRDNQYYHIPDFEMNQVISKSINYNTNLPSNVGGTSSNGDILFHFTPQSKFTQLCYYYNLGSTAAPQWIFGGVITPDQQLSQNFSLVRYVASYLEVTSSTIGAGAFSVQGQTWAVAYQDPASFYTTTAQSLLASRKDEESYLENYIVADGVVAVGDPNVNPVFLPPETNAITNIGPMFDVFFSNVTAGSTQVDWWTQTSAGSFKPPALDVADVGFFPNGQVTTDQLMWSVCSPGWSGPLQLGSSSQPAWLSAPALPPILRGDVLIDVQVLINNGAGAYFTNVLVLSIITADNNYSDLYLRPRTTTVDISGVATHAVVYNLNTEWSTVVPIVAMCLHLQGNPTAPVDSTNASINIKIKSPDIFRPGEVSNGIIAVVTGMPSPSNVAVPPQIISINSLIGYEAVPNFNLAQNVKTKVPRIDNSADIEAAKTVFANKNHYGVKSIYRRKEFEALVSGNHFNTVSMRSNIRAIAFGLDDLWNGVKDVGKFVGRAALPYVGAMLNETPLAPIAPLVNGGLSKLFSSDEPSRNSLKATAPLMHAVNGDDNNKNNNNMPGARRYLLCSDSGNVVKRELKKKVILLCSDVEHQKAMERALEADNESAGFFDEYSESKHNANLSTITQLPDFEASYVERDPKYVTAISREFQAQLNKMKYKSLRDSHKRLYGLVNFASFPVVMTDENNVYSGAQLIRIALTHLPFMMNFETHLPQQYQRVQVGMKNLWLSAGNFSNPEIENLTALLNEMIDTSISDSDPKLDNFYLTVGTPYQMEGNSLTMAVVALLLGLPDVAFFTGSSLRGDIFTPVTHETEKLEACIRMDPKKPLLCATTSVEFTNPIQLQIRKESRLRPGYRIYTVSELIPTALSIYEIQNNVVDNPSMALVTKPEIYGALTKLRRALDSLADVDPDGGVYDGAANLFNALTAKLKQNNPQPVFSLRELNRINNSVESITTYLNANNGEPKVKIKKNHVAKDVSMQPVTPSLRKLVDEFTSEFPTLIDEKSTKGIFKFTEVERKVLHGESVVMPAKEISGLEKKLSDMIQSLRKRMTNYQQNSQKKPSKPFVKSAKSMARDKLASLDELNL